MLHGEIRQRADYEDNLTDFSSDFDDSFLMFPYRVRIAAEDFTKDVVGCRFRRSESGAMRPVRSFSSVRWARTPSPAPFPNTRQSSRTRLRGFFGNTWSCIRVISL